MNIKEWRNWIDEAEANGTLSLGPMREMLADLEAAERRAAALEAECGRLRETITETQLERDGLRNRIETLERRMRETALPFRSVLNWWMCSDPWPASKDDQFALECWLNKECEWRNYRGWVEAYHEEPDAALAPQGEQAQGRARGKKHE